MSSVRSEIFLALRKELLGPRNGSSEVIEENPKGEYVTGVLEPITFKRAPLEFYRSVDLRTGSDEIGEDDDVADYEADNLSVGFELDPRALPKSMGLSFVLSAKGSSFVNILATWARYVRVEKKKWKRAPSHLILREVDVTIDGRWEKNGIRVELRTNTTDEGDYYVSIFLVNDTPIEDRLFALTKDLVFQPQIRVNCCDGANLVPVRGEEVGDEEEAELSLLYLNRPTYGRGHLCSATWKSVDPERTFSSLKSPPHPSENPFVTIEESILSKEEKGYFTNPDLRTEFIPCYSIEQVRFHPRKEYIDLQNVSAAQLSEAWDSDSVRCVLGPIIDSYGKWIKDQEEETKLLPRNYQITAERLLRRSEDSLRRMKEGLDLIEENEELRLSFCFMNKVMNTQSMWKRGQPLNWRLFQIAFILQNVAGILKRDHVDRNVCDILWFPTGGGKTEAYLGLLILTLALRRRRRKDQADGGAGTAAISRYTLRMLTIQQFRRALVAIIACDYLRSLNWKPTNCMLTESVIWGKVRFSIGLWVGDEVTPNYLLDHKRFNRRAYRYEYFPGALGRLRGFDIYRDRGHRVVRTAKSEPAQVLHCPVCKAILAVPDKRVLEGGKHCINWIVNSPSKPVITTRIDGLGFKADKVEVYGLPNPTYYILSVTFTTSTPIGSLDVDRWWKNVIKPKVKPSIKEAFARPSRPGYFIRKWDVSQEDVDFQIHCPNSTCELNATRWQERVYGLDGEELTTDPLEPFSIPNCEGVSHGVPISAYVVDDQIYHRCPSLIVSTVDKFARLPFNPKAAAIFGNVNRYDSCWGFYRDDITPDRSEMHSGKVISIPRFDRPELVVQDELHLIEGPLGSMVGIYELAVEELASAKIEDTYVRPKYVASSATIREASPHVEAIFNRSISIFPPPITSADDNFFSYSREAHPLDSKSPGRLYAGICSPGRGPQTPAVRIWASLLQSAFEFRRQRGDDDPEVDQFWTLIGYFNALRELAMALSLYKVDIVQRLRQRNSSPRPLEPSLDLSSRMDSSEIPIALNQLSKFPSNLIDAVLATSMFGTGVDVDRLGLMIVHGQPKTTSNYIQATGRVGRKMGGLIVTFHRSTRPRDLDHYEFFVGYHRCLHKYVEPIASNPFSPRARERALGPVMVALLRNATYIDTMKVNPDWAFEEAYVRSVKRTPASGSRTMRNHRKAGEVQKMVEIIEKRSQSQPEGRKPRADACRTEAESLLDRWKAAADTYHDLLYSERTMTKEPQYPVVLGDPQHETHNLPIVYEKTPHSLREVESQTRFEA